MLFSFSIMLFRPIFASRTVSEGNRLKQSQMIGLPIFSISSLWPLISEAIRLKTAAGFVTIVSIYDVFHILPRPKTRSDIRFICFIRRFVGGFVTVAIGMISRTLSFVFFEEVVG
jgi:hypothetical protein